MPRISTRLVAADIGLIINTADPYSVAVGEYYARRRELTPQQVLRVTVPHKPVLNPAEFEALQQQVQAFFGAQVQALALAWREPYAVACNSITAALSLGFDAAVCQNSCAPTRLSPYVNSASARPWTELGLRPSMLLAASDEAAARRMIDRGVASDGTLGLRGAPPVHALYLDTDDAARNVRSRLYPPSPLPPRSGVEVHREPADAAPSLARRADRADRQRAHRWIAGTALGRRRPG